VKKPILFLFLEMQYMKRNADRNENCNQSGGELSSGFVYPHLVCRMMQTVVAQHAVEVAVKEDAV
jgi:hypothetical protein